MPKPLIAIVTGIANGFAEQELLRGIIAEYQKNGYSTVVFSNIYNIVQEDAYLECERRIYELVYSQDVSGVILFCESFVEERARRAVASMLQKVTVPVIGIGSELSEFAVLSIPRQNTDDVQEFEDLTDLPSDALPGYDRIYQDHVWMIRNKRSMYLRLIADWYDPDSAPDGLMQSRCILPWEDTSIFGNDRYDLQVLFDWEPGAAVCYYTTVFSGNRLFGDMAVLYDTPDGYDDVFRHWLKSVSIGLEFLRLKKWHLTRGSHRFSSGCFLHFKILHFSVVRRLGIDKLKLPKKRSFSLSIKLCF